jgi:Immunity protein 49
VSASRDEINRERLAATRARLADENVERDQAQAFWSFGDALDAAGLAAAVGEDEDAVRELLRRAAREARDIFALRDTEEPDTSATSPGTLVRALYSAAVAQDEEALEYLARLEPADYHSEQVVAGAVLESFAPVLQRAVTGADLAAHARAALEGWGQGDVGQRTWLAQLRALERLGERDRDGFGRAIDDVAEAERAYARAAERDESDPELALALPVRGLRALGARREP